MENIIDLQQEFEELIAHLETLNSLQEITSTNTESATAIIQKMEAVAQSIETFKDSLNQDYLKKVEIFNRAQENLSTAVSSLNAQVNNLIKEIAAIIDPFSNNLNNLLQGQLEAISEKINRFQSLTEQLREEVNTKVDQTTERLDNIIKIHSQEVNSKVDENLHSVNTIISNHTQSIDNKIQDFQESINASFFSQAQEISGINQTIETKFNTLDKTFQEGIGEIQAVKSEMEAIIQENQKTLISKIGDYDKITQQRLDKLEKNSKFIKVLGIGSVLLCIVLVILLLLK